MGKITKLATVVAKAARMEKKAEYYDAIATFINPDGNYFEKRKFMGEYTEEEIIKEVLKEFPKVKKEDIDIEFGVQSSKKVKLTKKAESELSDYVEQIRNKGEKVKYEIDKIVERYKYRLDNTFGQADAKKYGIEVYHKLDEAQKLINSIYKIIG